MHIIINWRVLNRLLSGPSPLQFWVSLVTGGAMGALLVFKVLQVILMSIFQSSKPLFKGKLSCGFQANPTVYP